MGNPCPLITGPLKSAIISDSNSTIFKYMYWVKQYGETNKVNNNTA